MRSRRGLANVLLGLLVAVSAVCACLVPWRSALVVDDRTWIEMIAGVARHGLPYLDNGSADLFPALQARFNAFHSGHLWGEYPPLYAYLAQPFFWVHGVRGVVGFNVLLLATSALGSAALARRLSGDPLHGAIAAWITITGPVWVNALQPSPYPLATALAVWTVHATAASLDSPERAGRAWALAAGVLAAGALASHLLFLGVVGASLACLVFTALPAVRSRLMIEVPSREALMRSALAAGGFLAVLAPVMALNLVRFGTPNPLSMGHCVWRMCQQAGHDPQSINEFGGMYFASTFAHAAPLLAWMAVVAVLGWTFRRSRLGLAGVLLAACASLVFESPWSSPLKTAGKVLWTILVEPDRFPIGPDFPRATDGVGAFVGPFVLRSMLQTTPAFMAVAWVTRAPGARRAGLAVVMAAIAGHLGVLVLNSMKPIVEAVGWPSVGFRYALPILPLLAAMLPRAVSDLGWKRSDVVLTGVVAAALGWGLSVAPDDNSLVRRIVLLHGTLVVGVVASFTIGWARWKPTEAQNTAARLAIAVAIAYGAGASLGGALPSLVRLRTSNEQRFASVEAKTPERFALVGWCWDVDTVLALRATRDIEYLDLGEVDHAGIVRDVVLAWQRQGRPVFALFPGTEARPPRMAGVRLEVHDRATGLYRMEAEP